LQPRPELKIVDKLLERYDNQRCDDTLMDRAMLTGIFNSWAALEHMEDRS